MELSEFLGAQKSFPDAELLPVSGATCDCYRVKFYGKLHFMKRLKPEFSTDPRYVAALQKEFETGFRLDHPHLIRYVAKGDDYLLTEYVDGLTLGAFLDENPSYFKSVQNANRFLTQLLEVVGYLHQHQVVHLDLKPNNILITRIGHEAKLTDLGFCYTDGYTDTMGRTDKYAAPEQLEGSTTVDARTDIYAIGKILDILPLSPIYNKVKDRCLKKKPTERFQSTEEIKASLPSERRRWPWLALSILGIMMVLGIWLYQKPQAKMVPEKKSTIIENPLPNDTIKPAIQENHSEPSISDDGQGAISNKKTDNHNSYNDQLVADIQKEVEKNLAETLDPYGDSLRRSRSPIYSAGIYLRELNMSSAKSLYVKYPHVSKVFIDERIDEYTMKRMDEMDD